MSIEWNKFVTTHLSIDSGLTYTHLLAQPVQYCMPTTFAAVLREKFVYTHQNFLPVICVTECTVINPKNCKKSVLWHFLYM